MKIIIAAIAALTLAACASSSSDITPTYVSPVTYQNHTCAQLAQEAQAISARAVQIAGVQDQQRTNDAIATGVAIVVFWPAAFLVGGNRQAAAELASLRVRWRCRPTTARHSPAWNFAAARSAPPRGAPRPAACGRARRARASDAGRFGGFTFRQISCLIRYDRSVASTMPRVAHEIGRCAERDDCQPDGCCNAGATSRSGFAGRRTGSRAAVSKLWRS